jgi:shikimate dehydrogenase
MGWAAPPIQWPTGSTRLAGVIGAPVRHSLSPALHNASFAALGLDWVYLAFPVPPGRVGGAVAAMRALPIAGLNVTMPHKASILPHLDRVSPTVAALGAANTLVLAGDEVVGENVDGDGFLDALRLDLGFEPEGRRCLVVGAGGAARAVVLALAQAGAGEVLVANRTPVRAEKAASLAGRAGKVGTVAQAGEADLVVNATPVGMGGAGGPAVPGPAGPAVARPGAAEVPGPGALPGTLAGEGGSPVPAGCLGPGQLVIDLIYHPHQTELLAEAATRGARTANGLGMLVRQAARSFRLWTGVEAPVEAMWAAARVASGVERRGDPRSQGLPPAHEA